MVSSQRLTITNCHDNSINIIVIINEMSLFLKRHECNSKEEEIARSSSAWFENNCTRQQGIHNDHVDHNDEVDHVDHNDLRKATRC